MGSCLSAELEIILGLTQLHLMVESAATGAIMWMESPRVESKMVVTQWAVQAFWNLLDFLNRDNTVLRKTTPLITKKNIETSNSSNI